MLGEGVDVVAATAEGSTRSLARVSGILRGFSAILDVREAWRGAGGMCSACCSSGWTSGCNEDESQNGTNAARPTDSQACSRQLEAKAGEEKSAGEGRRWKKRTESSGLR